MAKYGVKCNLLLTKWSTVDRFAFSSFSRRIFFKLDYTSSGALHVRGRKSGMDKTPLLKVYVKSYVMYFLILRLHFIAKIYFLDLPKFWQKFESRRFRNQVQIQDFFWMEGVFDIASIPSFLELKSNQTVIARLKDKWNMLEFSRKIN